MKICTIIICFLSLCAFGQKQVINTETGSITIHPVLHASMILEWNGQTIYIDPYGGKEKYEKYNAPSLILITDIHGDHMNKETLETISTKKAMLIAPNAVTTQLTDLPFKSVQTLSNGENYTWNDIHIEAIPMYNLPETEDSRHPKGRGNGYLLTIDGKRIYISGDTEDINEMRSLENIDIAFICMNLPYTMDINQAADAVLAFKPSVVYPFHYRGGGGKFSNTEAFKKIVLEKDAAIEVRLIDWYN